MSEEKVCKISKTSAKMVVDFIDNDKYKLLIGLDYNEDGKAEFMKIYRTEPGKNKKLLVVFENGVGRWNETATWREMDSVTVAIKQITANSASGTNKSVFANIFGAVFGGKK